MTDESLKRDHLTDDDDDDDVDEGENEVLGVTKECSHPSGLDDDDDTGDAVIHISLFVLEDDEEDDGFDDDDDSLRQIGLLYSVHVLSIVAFLYSNGTSLEIHNFLS